MIMVINTLIILETASIHYLFIKGNTLSWSPQWQALTGTDFS